RDRLRDAVDRAIGFARAVGADPEREADARAATSALYHAASTALLAWEAWRRRPRSCSMTARSPWPKPPQSQRDRGALPAGVYPTRHVDGLEEASMAA